MRTKEGYFFRGIDPEQSISLFYNESSLYGP